MGGDDIIEFERLWGILRKVSRSERWPETIPWFAGMRLWSWDGEFIPRRFILKGSISGNISCVFICRVSKLKSSMYKLSPGCMIETNLSPPPPPCCPIPLSNWWVASFPTKKVPGNAVFKFADVYTLCQLYGFPGSAEQCCMLSLLSLLLPNCRSADWAVYNLDPWQDARFTPSSSLLRSSGFSPTVAPPIIHSQPIAGRPHSSSQ